MPTPVIMPKFGMAQEEGTIIRWLKQAGDVVTKGETLLEVQTDKIDMEVEATADGILTDVRYGVDATVPVTTIIAYIAAPGEVVAPVAAAPASAVSAAPTPPTEVRASPVAQRMAAATGVDLAQIAGSGPAGRIVKRDVANVLADVAGASTATSAPPAPAVGAIRATPAARRLARTHAVDLATLAGSGPAGRIQAVDVMEAASGAGRGAVVAAPPPSVRLESSAVESSLGEPLRGKRRVIATRLSQSWQQAPHIFFTSAIDLTRLDALTNELAAAVAAGGGRLTLTVWIARAVAAALTRHPRLNAWLQLEGEQWVYRPHAAINLGIAVALEDGLIVPVVRDAGSLGLTTLAARIADLATRARSGQLTPDEVSGGTFSLSNLGMHPVEHFTAIINPPEVAILAVGQAQLQPVWNGAAFEPHRMVKVTLSVDHRAIDGAVAAAFLADLKSLLEAPVRLLL
ncbi:MAG TPA: 2-oxo acid dehydrogenase subunit E2 [Chloroflexi bacterium]|nr:2-oxo acid dehydrogenase subunit E2 [Chloroflexota bacterium]